MPVIDFQCQKCGHKFYEITTSAERDKIRCPQCGSGDLKQVFGGTAYVTGGKKSSGGSCGSSCSTCSGCH